MFPQSYQPGVMFNMCEEIFLLLTSPYLNSNIRIIVHRI
jgi:hypothetical protein